MLVSSMNISANNIIGIGGLPRSGKDSLAEYFIQSNFYGVSLGDIVRDYSRERHADKPDPISVSHMTETSNWLRSQNGPDFALKEAQARFERALKNNPELKGLVVYSVRAPAEVDYILAHDGDLIWVEADDRTRYERAMSNLRAGEVKVSFADFTAQEKLQWQPQPNIPKEVQMNIKYVKESATTVLDNNGSFDQFAKVAQKLVAKFLDK